MGQRPSVGGTTCGPVRSSAGLRCRERTLSRSIPAASSGVFARSAAGAMQKYRLVAKKGEGTFSEVLKAQSVKTNRFTAIKCMKTRFDSIDQVRVKAHDVYTCPPHTVALPQHS